MGCIRCVLFAIACFLPGYVRGSTIALTQAGWEFGGPLTVLFNGQDSNLDGQIDEIELTAFSATYRLPQGGSTTWSLADIEPDGLQFIGIGDFLFFATNTAYTLIDSGFEGEVHGSVVNSFLFPVDITEELPTPIPEPSGLGYFVAPVVLAYLARAVKAGRVAGCDRRRD